MSSATPGPASVVVTEIIARKRDGKALTPEEISSVVAGLMRGAVSDAQMAALLMATVLRGMSEEETAALTQAMLHSGEVLDLSSIAGLKVDKHSTGGVGDKTTLVVAPLVAALGVPVPKMSGRALGHTGGTIDKLECIPGLRTDLSPARFRQQVAEIGVAIASQSDRMAPADKRIYALRDATATVESVPLIAASVMSKKLAAGADALVLDVKVGEGAFMAQRQQARALAEMMVRIGRGAGKRVVALVTAMDQPLGRTVGDALEVGEAVETLHGQGPEDFTDLCGIVAGYMLLVGGKAATPEEGRRGAQEALRSGAGLAKLRELVRAQGGAPEVVDDPSRLLGDTECRAVSLAQEGHLVRLDARQVGLVLRQLKEAAGPRKACCGVLLLAKCGEKVGDAPVARVIGPRGAGAALEEAARALAGAYGVAGEPVTGAALLQEVIA